MIWKEKYVTCWTNKFLHSRNKTSSRCEGQHSIIKKFTDSSREDLLSVYKSIHDHVKKSRA